MKLSRYRCLIVLPYLWSFACGSGEESLTLVADPPTLAADGESIIDLAAKVVFRGDPLPDGKRVTFRASAPVLFESREDATPDVVGGRQTGATEVEVETSSGAAHAYLLAPTEAGVVAITASYTTVNKDVLSEDANITLLPPPLVLSARGNGSEGNTINYFEFSCERVNIGGFVADRAEIRVPCTVRLRDATGRELHHVPVDFFTEAGDMEVTPATPDSPRAFTYVVPPSPSEKPRDVRAAQAETDATLVDNGGGVGIVENNPRDGLVTILARVRGQEGFVDANNNGSYDGGEQFLDEGEPFLDFDDDGEYDAAKDAPLYGDTNANNRVDGPNGSYDKDVYLGRIVHILWTGELDNDPSRTFLLATPSEIPAGAAADIRLRMTDFNYNPVASSKISDKVKFSGLVTTKAAMEPVAAYNDGLALEGSTGMELRASFPTFVFGDGKGPLFVGLTRVDGNLDGREWSNLTVVDKRAATSSTLCTVQSWTLSAEISYTIAPSYSGATFSTLTGSRSVSGTLGVPTPLPAQCQ